MNEQQILSKFKEEISQSFGVKLPEFGSLTEMQDFLSQGLAQQTEQRTRRDQVLERYGAITNPESKPPPQAAAPQTEKLRWEDGRLDEIEPESLTQILQRQEKKTPITGQDIQQLSQKWQVPAGMLVTMYKMEGLLKPSQDLEGQRQNLDTYAGFMKRQIVDKGVNNSQGLAQSLNPNNPNLADRISNIYNSFN